MPNYIFRRCHNWSWQYLNWPNRWQHWIVTWRCHYRRYHSRGRHSWRFYSWRYYSWRYYWRTEFRARWRCNHQCLCHYDHYCHHWVDFRG